MPDDLWTLDYDTVVMILDHYHDLAVGAQLSTGEEKPEYKNLSGNARAPYEGSCMLAAEVARRVRRCGQDGYLVEERYGLNLMASPKTIEQIADDRALLDTEIHKRIKRVIWYCVGRKAKTEEYWQWMRDKKYRRKPVIMMH
jgi:hypothetical protein